MDIPIVGPIIQFFQFIIQQLPIHLRGGLRSRGPHRSGCACVASSASVPAW